VKAELWQLDPGAKLKLASEDARRLMLVLEGQGKAAADRLGTHFGIQIDPGETATISADSKLTLLSFYLPPVSREWTEPQLPSFEPVPGESVRDPV
jgi:redox-sensitive bicupin YhaK (pirin superfamily)